MLNAVATCSASQAGALSVHGAAQALLKVTHACCPSQGECAALKAELQASEHTRESLAADLTAKAAALTKLESEAAVLQGQAEAARAEAAASKGGCRVGP